MLVRLFHRRYSIRVPWHLVVANLPPGGVLGPKIAGGVPRATENWTQKD